MRLRSIMEGIITLAPEHPNGPLKMLRGQRVRRLSVFSRPTVFSILRHLIRLAN